MDVIFGIRPEHMRGTREGDIVVGAETVARLEVDLVEMLGSHVQLTLACGPERLIALADPALPVKPGDRIPVVFNMDSMHLFEKREPQRRIDAAPAA